MNICGNCRPTTRHSRSGDFAPVRDAQKLAELQETIQLRTSFDEDAARSVVKDDRGRVLMAQITTLLDAITADENQVLPKGNAAIEQTWRRLHELTWGGLAAAILFMSLAAQMLRQGAGTAGQNGAGEGAAAAGTGTVQC